MKRIFTIILFLLTFFSMSQAQSLVPHQYRHPFLLGPAAAFQNGLLGSANPASSVTLKKFNFRYYWANHTEDAHPRDWALYTAVKGLGFGAFREKLGSYSVTDYNFSLAAGGRNGGFGIGYTWSKGDKALLNRENLFNLGWLIRPSRHLALGLIGHFSTESSAKEGVVEMGLRPLGTPILTFFGDYSLQNDDAVDDVWSAGAALQVAKGIALTGRYFEDEAFTVGLSIGWNGDKFSAQGHFDRDQEHQTTAFGTGFGDYQPSIFEDLFKGKKRYLAMELKGRVDYQKYKWFDDATRRFMDILTHIRQAKADDAVDVIALNISAMRIYPEHAWEIRQELKAAKAVGKKVVIFFENAQMTGYQLASVADVVMMDPQGSLMLPGYSLSRTYMKGTLEKLGLGFDEWRFFEYKSALESFSRDKMSDADRQQRQDLVDDWYQLAATEIGEERGISAEKFDQLVDNNVYFMPADARKEGLVDTLCRWNALGEVISKLTKDKRVPMDSKKLSQKADYYQNWGSPPKIAVVYALGACAMDSGIRARWLEKVLLKLAGMKKVKAIVLRVDSPGGDGMASDVVAEALKKCKEKKPVIISQGQVAASGGYWISMYGDKIFAGPGTITGSIGVIGGWVYDKGMSDKIGMTSDLVKRGRHADLGKGIRLPIVGLEVPARNLTDEERSRVEDLFHRFYGEFVKKVAAGRNMPEAKVREIAEGHVFSGIDGKGNGLIDGIGGLTDAIETAREMAGIPAGEKYEIWEIPKFKGQFNSNFFSPFGIKKAIEEDPAIRFIRMINERPGFPHPMLVPGDYPILE